MEPYPRKVEMWPKRADDVLSQVRLFRVPNETNGDDFRAVHQNSADLNTLPTVALRIRKKSV